MQITIKKTLIQKHLRTFFFLFLKSSGASHSLTYKRRSVHYSSLFAKQGKSQSFKEIGKKKDESLEPPSLTAPRSLFLFPLRPQERRGKKDTLGNPSQSLSHSILNIRRVIKKFNDLKKRESSPLRLKWKREHSSYYQA